MTDRKAILNKIRKCLALAKSANEHEAAAALAKAQALMREYGIDQGDVAFDKATARGNGAHRPPNWEGILLDAVTRAIPCEVILHSGKFLFIGRAPSAELAAYAFAVLHRQLKRARTEYTRTRLKRVRPGRKTARADLFCEGWASTVRRKISALNPHEHHDQALQDYVTGRFRTVPVETRDAGRVDSRTAGNDYFSGVASGRGAELNKPMGAAASRPVLTT
ncbi:DUF2786 domain-containing protein [Sphingobium aquiterrae]|uniref:DUF2786 domain-containing protein n=1 Tax=Sphingobium aquiterrae TaxID=2038656 RepID=UPI003017995D